MAIGLPTSSLDVEPQGFRRTTAIKSGQSAAALSFSTLRELTQEQNFLLAYKTRTLASYEKWAVPGDLGTGDAWFNATTSASYQRVIPYVYAQLGADVASIELLADVQDAYVQLETSQGNAAGNTTGSARQIVSVTKSLSSTGAVLYARINIKKNATTAKIFGWAIREVYMVAGDFP